MNLPHHDHDGDDAVDGIVLELVVGNVAAVVVVAAVAVVVAVGNMIRYIVADNHRREDLHSRMEETLPQLWMK